MKLKIRQVEEYTTYIVRDSIEIDTENFEQLKGLDQQAAIAYIQDNYDELYPDEGTEWEPQYSYTMSISNSIKIYFSPNFWRNWSTKPWKLSINFF